MSAADDEKPFRIPRKQRQEISRRGHHAAKIDFRPSVVHAPANWKDPSHGYGRPIVPLKRKATSSTETGEKKRNKDGSNNSPVETILQSMQVPTTKKQLTKEKERISETESPKPSTKFRRSGESSLTKEKVERHSSLQEYYSFGKKGLMEALLEHKMKTGRIDPHSEIGLSLNYRPSVDPFHPTATEDFTPPLASSPPRKGPRTPPGTPPSPPPAKKGPATPPYSPPADSSSDSRSPSFRGRSEDSGSVTEFVERTESKSYASPEKTVPKPPESTEENKEVLEKLARMARVDVDHLKNCLNPDVLNTLKQLDSSVLLATVSTVLSTLAQTVAKGQTEGRGEGHPEVSSSSVSPKGMRNKNAPEQEREPLVSSTGLKDESVEMDLESNSGDDNQEMKSGGGKESLSIAPMAAGEGQIPIMRVNLTRGQIPLQGMSLPPPAPPQQQPPPPPVPFQPPPANLTVRPPPVDNNQAAPNQVQMIQTLLTALAIPRPAMSAPSPLSSAPPGPPRFNVPPPPTVNAVMAQIRPEILSQGSPLTSGPLSTVRLPVFPPQEFRPRMMPPHPDSPRHLYDERVFEGEKHFEGDIVRPHLGSFDSPVQPPPLRLPLGSPGFGGPNIDSDFGEPARYFAPPMEERFPPRPRFGPPGFFPQRFPPPPPFPDRRFDYKRRGI